MGDNQVLDGKPPRESRCETRGWRFESRNGPALSSHARTRFAQETLAPIARVPLPEMVFAQSELRLTNLSQRFVVRFEAAPALALWATRHQAEHWDHTNFDFTYGTNYLGTVERSIVSVDDAKAAPVEAVRTSERLPHEKLLQHVEILFFDRVLLFEDDVRDLGEIYLEVKTRVMGFGFLVLLRYYCRVDDKSVKLMDTRYYHEFGQDFLWRDHEVREATIQELKQLLYANVSATTSDEAHFRQLDFSADAIYPVLAPREAVTEKIYFI